MRCAVVVIVALLPLWLVCSCQLLIPLGTPAEGDARSPDLAADAPVDAAPAAERPADQLGAPDRHDMGPPLSDQGEGLDQGALDLGEPPDSAPSPLADQGGPLDGGLPDSPVADAAWMPDLAVIAGACSTLATEVVIPAQWSTGAMQLCHRPSGVDQCSAASLCAAPAWHLCTASEYRARGGTLAGGVFDGWLSSCVRDGAGVFPPSAAVCSTCKADQDTLALGQWSCGTGTAVGGNYFIYLGVMTWSQCRRIGSNSASSEAFWLHQPASVSLLAAVCCK